MKKKVWTKTSISLATAHAIQKHNRKEKKITCQRQTQKDENKYFFAFRKEVRQVKVSIALGGGNKKKMSRRQPKSQKTQLKKNEEGISKTSKSKKERIEK
jgi:hypothetical protein